MHNFKFQQYRSLVQDRVPISSDLEEGEFFVNLHPNSLGIWSKDGSGNVVLLTGGSGGVVSPLQEFKVIPVTATYALLEEDLTKWLIIESTNSTTTSIEIQAGAGEPLENAPIGWQCVIDNLGPNDVPISVTTGGHTVVAEFFSIPANYGSVHLTRQTAFTWRVVGDLVAP